MFFRVLSSLTLLLLSGTVIAQQSSQGSAPLEPLVVDPAADGLSRDLRELSAMDREQERANRVLTQLRTELEIREARKALEGETVQAPAVPPLVGIMGSQDRLVAEFLVGSGIRTATEGDYVTSQWRVERIAPGQVDIAGTDGSARHTLLLGHAAPGSGPIQPSGPVVPARQMPQAPRQYPLSLGGSQ